MTDIFDRATEIEELERDSAIAAQAARTAQAETPFEIQGKRVCLDCFVPITKRRLVANPQAVRCVECQQDHDRQKKRGR